MGSATGQTVSPAYATLGGSPVCEASAGLLIACPKSRKTCLLVGDNEIRNRLFIYEMDGAHVAVESRRTLDIGHLLDEFDDDRGELSDIEALVGLPEGRVLVFGSHSRNTSCRDRPNRRRLLLARLDAEQHRFSSGTAFEGPPHTCEALLVGDVGDRPLVQKVCAAIEKAEEAAKAVRRMPKPARRTACERASPLNAEGAMAIPKPGEGAEVWVGLRAPLVDGKAILLRQAAERTQFRFDAAMLLNLGGRGVRALAFSRGWVWGIAGAPLDDVAAFELWRLPISKLRHGADETVEPIAKLPNASEGLAILGNTAIVLMDGEQARGSEQCVRPAAYTLIRVPH